MSAIQPAPAAEYRPTAGEQRAYAEMQARLVALLLRFDEADYSRRYGQRAGRAAGAADALQPYRDLAALTLLRDELFDDILPRILRRLSFESPRHHVVEEPPPRGRVDWERTLEASWAERPGEPPLLVHTRQRRRDFATPENLLAVALLLEYRNRMLHMLWDERTIPPAEALRHPLNAIVERCERELAFPQLAGIRSLAEPIVEAEAVGELADQVAERDIPGGNSAYADLIAWRARLLGLPLLQRDPDAAGTLTLGADPKQDNYLYQLWLFYELADLLCELGCATPQDISPWPLRLRFRWEGCTYELRHDQAVPLPLVSWATDQPKARTVPGVRPDYYLWRVDPPLQHVRHEKRLIWREPGVIWDAKYYREREQRNAPSPPVKRMVADLTLLGEPYGVLLFAFLRGAADDGGYQIAPDAPRDQTITPGQRVGVRQLQPALHTAEPAVRQALLALVREAHERLGRPIIPRCHGIFLDRFSAEERDGLVGRGGEALDGQLAELLICPKPHIGPWRVDLVRRDIHCCKDGAVCHIINRPNARPPVRPPRTAHELLRELRDLFDQTPPEQMDDQTAGEVARQVTALSRRFAEVSGALKRIHVYEAQLRTYGMGRTLDTLGPAERESLALAVFLVEQISEVQASDFSAPVIHIASVLELEVQRRLLAVPGLSGAAFQRGKPTYGTLGFMRKSPERTGGDWDLLTAYLADRWQGRVDPDDPDHVVTFDEFVRFLDQSKHIRNMAAHTSPVSHADYGRYFRTVCQAGPLRVGALNALLLAWPA